MTEQSEFVVSEKYLFPVIERLLEEGKSVRFTVSGNSMWPFLCHNRDSVILVPCRGRDLRRGDIILFETGSRCYILHRITKVRDGGYLTTGDGNCHRDGFVSGESVRARVRYLYRKGKRIDCDSQWWRLVFALWMAAFPVRGVLLRGLRAVGRFYSMR